MKYDLYNLLEVDQKHFDSMTYEGQLDYIMEFLDEAMLSGQWEKVNSIAL